MLIACPECEHRVSDRAPSCPSCGFPIAEEMAKLAAAQAAEQARASEVVVLLVREHVAEDLRAVIWGLSSWGQNPGSPEMKKQASREEGSTAEEEKEEEDEEEEEEEKVWAGPHEAVLLLPQASPGSGAGAQVGRSYVVEKSTLPVPGSR